VLGSALEALQVLLSVQHLVWLLVGVGMGLILGIIPGIGGLTGMAVLLPLIGGFAPESAIAMLIGIMATNTIGDTFPSVLMGVPGGAGSASTVVDGYPLARKGLANVALGASFTANMVGGLIGAVTLFLMIPFARQIILGLGSPQLFMLTLLGFCMVAVLAQGAIGPSLVSGLIGMFLASVGSASMTGEYRFIGGIFYLYDGIDLLILAIGLFAFPSILSLLTQGQSVATSMQYKRGGVLRGARTALRHKRVILGNSVLGTALGVIPGIGGNAIDWLSYGITKRTVRKDRGDMGHGDIRGVIAPEAANNAKDGGVLIPALMFGIPGSATAAILLGGLSTLGVATGPSLLREENLYLVLVIVWTLVLANAIGALACMGMSRPLSTVTLIKPYMYAPFLLVIMFVASYQPTLRWGDLVAVVVIGLLAWLMQAMKWPRPPLLIGFVLGQGAENYLWISVGRYGFEWLTWPSVIAIGLLCVLTVSSGFINVLGRVLSRVSRAGADSDRVKESSSGQ
jgi:putative tricarboxylic transport membrane protein